MEKLYGLIISLAVVVTGLAIYITGTTPVIAASLVFIGLGLNLYYERRVVKEASSRAEKMMCSILPPVAEAGLITALLYTTEFEIMGVVYLGLAMVLSEGLNRSQQLGDINSSRLLGRIARVLVLTSGLVLSYFSGFIVFYAVAFSAVIIMYDFLIVLSEVRGSSTI